MENKNTAYLGRDILLIMLHYYSLANGFDCRPNTHQMPFVLMAFAANKFEFSYKTVRLKLCLQVGLHCGSAGTPRTKKR
ncbi:hypothetical protein [Moraxella sp. Pampa]|uniref:hypothetical protein n=1 Tax=Moraxella sp. Pampa TaxID=3111978 RepID=UPI002B40F1F2|nr:hypothetical protein [Moraxella sp. Pampa]